MNEAILKTIILVLLIGVGFILKSKFGGKDKLDGIKEIVLSVALPSTIFIALLKIELDISLLFVPLVVLVFNFIMFFITPLVLSSFGISQDSSTTKTLTLLLPSLAPGLSCFPFIIEFLGDKSLALAAMGDIGNKFFVLIFLYIIAMNMSMKSTGVESKNIKEKLMSLLGSLAKEPINIILLTGILLLSFGINYESLPNVVTGVFDKTSALMTPLVLIFIGLAVKFKEGNKRIVFSLLVMRAGFSLLLSTTFVLIAGLSSPEHVLLAIIFPLSSVSFWPFAHIAMFNTKEEELNLPKEKKSFNIELAIMILAISLPFSTTVILTILTAGTYFTDLWKVSFLGLGLIITGIVPLVASRIFSFKTNGKLRENHLQNSKTFVQ
jgi:predicted permease